MLSIIKQLRQSLAAATETAAAPFSDLQLAAGVLLLEVSSSDFERHPEEKAAALGALGRAFGLNGQQLEILYEHALSSADNAVSLYEFVSVINRECDQAQKMRLLEDLWRVAYSDGRLDKYEDNRIRRIAELLYMPHRAFIQSKHAAEAAMSERADT